MSGTGKPPPLSHATHLAMAENCEAAAHRLATSDAPADQRDAATFAAVAALHRAQAERTQKATYWWHDREEAR